MALLSVLMDGDLYGYEMSQLISERSEGKFMIPEGSMYPALYRLEDNGYVSSRRELVSKRMTRVYYHLEERGREYFTNMKEEYYSVTSSMMRILKCQEEGGGKG